NTALKVSVMVALPPMQGTRSTKVWVPLWIWKVLVVAWAQAGAPTTPLAAAMVAVRAVSTNSRFIASPPLPTNGNIAVGRTPSRHPSEEGRKWRGARQIRASPSLLVGSPPLRVSLYQDSKRT